MATGVQPPVSTNVLTDDSTALPPAPATTKYALLLSGLMHSGKDASADILVAKAGFHRFALADPLRNVGLALWPVMEAMFGLVPWVPLTFEALTSQQTKNAPYGYGTMFIIPDWDLDSWCGTCRERYTRIAASYVGWCGFPEENAPQWGRCPIHGFVKVEREIKRLVLPGSVLVFPDNAPPDVRGLPVTRALFTRFFEGVLQRFTFQTFEGKTESAAVAFFDAFARMVAREGEEVAKLPLDAPHPCPSPYSSSCSGISASEKQCVGSAWSAPTFCGQRLTPRWILQWLGTDLCRTMLSDQIWIEATIRGIEDSRAPRVVLTDVRFPNEAEELPARLSAIRFQTLCLRVRDPKRPPQDVLTLHATERFVETLPVDAELVNDKTLGFEALEGSLRSVLKLKLKGVGVFDAE